MFRISSDESIPHHFEAVPLRTGVSALGWSLAVLTIASGLGLAGWASGAAADVVGPIVVIVGGLILAAMLRCRRCEITIGTKRIDVRSGPLRGMVPTGAVEAAARRPATVWRRLFADEEVVLSVSVGAGNFAIPSRRPAELIEALDELR